MSLEDGNGGGEGLGWLRWEVEDGVERSGVEWNRSFFRERWRVWFV